MLQRGVGESEGSIELACDPLMPGAASGDPAIVSQVKDSIAAAQSLYIPVSRLDDEIERQQLPLPDFVKIDIEGMELSALRGMTKLLSGRKPELYLEMHGATEEEKARKANPIKTDDYGFNLNADGSAPPPGLPPRTKTKVENHGFKLDP